MMMNQGRVATLQKILRDSYLEAKLKNPAYSLRAFARRVGLSPGELSEVMNGKRRVTKQMAQKVLPRLDLPSEEAKLLLEQTEKRRNSAAPTDPDAIASDWVHSAILALRQTSAYRADEEWIARRLGLTRTRVAKCLERIERQENPSAPAQGEWAALSEDNAFVMQKQHADCLDKARESLLDVAFDRQDFVGATLAIDPSKLEIAKNRIRETLRALCADLQGDGTSEVYRLGYHLFPLTKNLE